MLHRNLNFQTKQQAINHKQFGAQNHYLNCPHSLRRYSDHAFIISVMKSGSRAT